MRIQRCRPADLSSQRAASLGQAATAVVMDVLRMTSTAAVLMRRTACTSVFVAATLGDLERLPRPLAECVIISEVAGASGLGTWVDNSPARVSRMDFSDKTPVLVTTNGTRTLLAAAACADRILLASFRDLQAVARLARHLDALLLVPAGHFASGEARIEDDLCADALAVLLAGSEPDLAASAAIIRADARVRRRIEAEPGFAADLDLALEHDPHAAVLQFKPLDAGVGQIVRA